MKRWIGFLGHLVIVVVLTSFGINKVKEDALVVPKANLVVTNTLVNFPLELTEETAKNKHLVFLDKNFQGFKEAIAFKESQGDYSAVNTLGYLGKYQFGASTLKMMGVYDTNTFLRNPVLQEKIFQLNVSRNKWILRREIKGFVGKRIKGTTISESGIIAAAHLAGAGNVKKYLKSYGKSDFSDAYGSNVAYYIEKFKGYDISAIKSIHNPKI